MWELLGSKWPISLPIYSKMCYIMDSSPKTESLGGGGSPPWNAPWWIELNILFTHMWTILTVEIIVWWFIFNRSRQINRAWVRVHLGLCTPTTRTQKLSNITFLDAQKITGDGNFSVLSQYKKYTKVIGDIIK